MAAIEVIEGATAIAFQNTHVDASNMKGDPEKELIIECDYCDFHGLKLDNYKVVVKGSHVRVADSFFDGCSEKTSPIQTKQEWFGQTELQPQPQIIKETIMVGLSTLDWIIIVALIIFIPKLSWRFILKPIKKQWTAAREAWSKEE